MKWYFYARVGLSRVRQGRTFSGVFCIVWGCVGCRFCCWEYLVRWGVESGECVGGWYVICDALVWVRREGIKGKRGVCLCYCYDNYL